MQHAEGHSKTKMDHLGPSKQKHFQNKQDPPTVFYWQRCIFPRIKVKWLIREKERKPSRQKLRTKTQDNAVLFVYQYNN